MLLSLAIVLSAAAPSNPAQTGPICPVSRIEHADTARLKPHIARLGEMPPAKQLIAVLHTEGGCEKPIVVSDQVGMNRR
ncbi:hypothetical protein BH10PSE14_BH10PSE14_42720 [soil metagenome]